MIVLKQILKGLEMSNDEKILRMLELAELRDLVWDLYKDARNVRPRHFSNEQWDDKEFLIGQAVILLGELE